MNRNPIILFLLLSMSFIACSNEQSEMAFIDNSEVKASMTKLIEQLNYPDGVKLNKVIRLKSVDKYSENLVTTYHMTLDGSNPIWVLNKVTKNEELLQCYAGWTDFNEDKFEQLVNIDKSGAPEWLYSEVDFVNRNYLVDKKVFFNEKNLKEVFESGFVDGTDCLGISKEKILIW